MEETLAALKERRIPVVALTDAPRNPAEQRVERMGLDQSLTALYTMPGFPFPKAPDGAALVSRGHPEARRAGRLPRRLPGDGAAPRLREAEPQGPRQDSPDLRRRSPRSAGGGRLAQEGRGHRQGARLPRRLGGVRHLRLARVPRAAGHRLVGGHHQAPRGQRLRGRRGAQGRHPPALRVRSAAGVGRDALTQ